MIPLKGNSAEDTFDEIQKSDGLYGIMLQALRNLPRSKAQANVSLAHASFLSAAKEYLAEQE